MFISYLDTDLKGEIRKRVRGLSSRENSKAVSHAKNNVLLI